MHRGRKCTSNRHTHNNRNLTLGKLVLGHQYLNCRNEKSKCDRVADLIRNVVYAQVKVILVYIKKLNLLTRYGEVNKFFAWKLGSGGKWCFITPQMTPTEGEIYPQKCEEKRPNCHNKPIHGTSEPNY